MRFRFRKNNPGMDSINYGLYKEESASITGGKADRSRSPKIPKPLNIGTLTALVVIVGVIIAFLLYTKPLIRLFNAMDSQRNDMIEKYDK